MSKAFEFLEGSKSGPFFLCFSTTLHHGPAPWVNKFSLDADPRMTGEGFVAEGFDVLPPRKDVLERNRAAGFADRQAHALWLDNGIGAIIDKVKELGLEKDTLNVFARQPEVAQRMKRELAKALKKFENRPFGEFTN